MESISFYQILYQGQCLYIGSTNNLRNRYYEHKSNYKICQSNLYKTMKELSQNFEDFDFQVICIEEHIKESRLRRERGLIEKYQAALNQD